MSDRYENLIAAILEDDRAGMKALLAREPALACAAVPVARFEPGFAHWIYAGDTQLHVAAAAHRPEIVQLLIAAGAGVNAAGKHRGARPLHYAADGCPAGDAAAVARQVGTLAVLLQSGADLHAADKNGATPLHRAVRARCAAATRFLLGAGADATRKNRPGSTAFHLAVQNTGRSGSGSVAAKAGQREIIRAFREHGVSPAICDAAGRSVLDWATGDGIRELLTGPGPRN